MFVEELTLIKDVGLGAAGIVALFYLLRMVLSWSHAQSEKTLKLAEDISTRILQLSEKTISDNTRALERMQESLLEHMHQKESLIEAIQDQTDTFIGQMKECKNGRDKQLREILKKP